MTVAPGPYSTPNLGVAAFLLERGFTMTRLDVLEDRLAFTFEGEDVRLSGSRAHSSRRKPHAEELAKLLRVVADRVTRGEVTSGVERSTGEP